MSEPTSIKKPRWTQEDIDAIARMRGEGLTDAEIGTRLGRTMVSIQAMITKVKARGKGEHIESHKRKSSWTPERIAEAQKLLGEGLTQSRVARRLGTSPRYLNQMLRTVASGVITEDAPNEGIRIARIVPDLRRIAVEVEQARAVLRRAESRYQDAMQPILTVVRQALTTAGLVYKVELDVDDDQNPAHDLCEALRRQGYIIAESIVDLAD